MTLDSETSLGDENAGSFESVFVELTFSSFSDPEAYDPTNDSATTQGNKRLRNLLGISVISVNNDVQLDYDEANRQFRAVKHDGTSFTGSVTARVRIDGDQGA
ncbi:hypothetical protein OSG_eHP14_00230 [environmental Halophage eHP-14]|nr:hypothetical protein OSG_eHP14_00230 [environmental Halophage eHP-14]